MSKLELIYLKDIAETQTGPFGTQLHEKDYVTEGTPIVTVEHLGEISFNTQNLPLVSDADKERLIKYTLKQGDIVFSRVGSVDRCTYVSEKEDGWMFSGRCLRVRFNEKANAKYVSYYFRQKFFKEMMLNISVGATMPSLNTSLMDNIPLYLPSKQIQNKIASVLSALDSKIELNNRINAELEAMAKTIYDYWFVQFEFPFDFAQGKPDKNGRRSEPAELKPYKSSGGKMVWNEKLKREIPEGWISVELKDIANITMGQSPPGESYNEIGEGVVFYQGCTDFGSRFPSIRQYTTEPSRYAKPGDILLSVRAPVGTMNISITECCIGRGLAALNSKDNCTPFLFEVLRNLKQVFDRRNTDGTTFGAITKDDLFSLKVVKPTKNILKEFSLIFQPVFEKQNTIALENDKLSELRDWLLPMLMNGQVKVN